MTRARDVRTRITLASPGSLHPGAARLALLNWLLARRHGGSVLLRAGAAAESGEQDLDWLGLRCDGVTRPEARQARHAAAAEALKRTGRLYPCLESEEELRAKRDWRVRHGRPAIYDRAMLKLTPAQLAAAEAGGKRPYWRFRLSDGAVAWHDAVLGRTDVTLAQMSDPVAVQADGTPLPAFAAAVDDLDDGITDLVRGADHVGGSAVQLDMRLALGGDPRALRLAHVPQLHGGEGVTLRRLRGDGVEPAALAAYLAACGTGRAGDLPGLPALAAACDLSACTGAAAFDITAVQALNRRALARAGFADVAARLPPGATEAFWLAVRGGIDLLREAHGWWDVVAGTIVPPVIEGEAPLLRTALRLLPAEPWSGDVWSEWLRVLQAATGRSLAALAQPLRLALTGEDHGPDLAGLLPLIGRARAALRLQLAAA